MRLLSTDFKKTVSSSNYDKRLTSYGTVYNVRSQQVGVFFLVYSSLMFYYEKCMFKASGRLIFNLFIINQYCTPKIFYHEFYETSVKGRVFKLLLFNLFSHIFSNWCISLIYIKFPRTTTF